jgi:hypothetical protein
VTTPELVSNFSAGLVHDLPMSQTSPLGPYALLSGAKTFGGYYQTNGASVAENRIYYNEFDTNYDVTGLSGLTFPQDAVVDTQVITGSGGLGWTSTTGSITSLTLRQGDNDFHGGYTAVFTPGTSSLLRPQGDNQTYLTASGKSAYSLYQSKNHYDSSLIQDAWASGPIIKDKLFFFVLLGNSPPAQSNSYYYNTTQQYSSRDKNFMFNVTWNISQDQTLNIAAARDWSSTSTNQYQLTQPYSTTAVGAPTWSGTLNRQKLLIGNYHWRITDNLSLRAMAGYTRFDAPSFNSAPASAPYINVYDNQSGINTLYGTSAYDAPNNYYYARRGYKADLNWTLGDHTLTFGGDRYNNNFHFVPYWRPYWDYEINNTPGYILDNGYAVPASNNYVAYWAGHFGGDFGSQAYGEYLYDTWQITDRVVLTGGIRWDHMVSKEGDGSPFLNMLTTSPRIGAAWDVRGDSSLKLGLNIGIYTLPMPSGLNYFVGGSNFISGTFYSYTGMDSSHLPLGLSQIGPTVVYSDGKVPDASTLSSANLKNTSQHNIQFYAQQQLTPTWALTSRFDLNQLDNIVDFISDSAGQITNYVRAHGYPNYAGLGTGGLLFNPGRDVVLRGDLGGNGSVSSLVIPNSYLGIPKATRNYYDLDFKLEHSRTDDEPYYLALNYTWSHLYGNEDGYASESHGTGALQAAGRSGNFNYPQYIPGSHGNLAADIRHKFVASGAYWWQSGLFVSSVFGAQTGAPYGCFGSYPDPAVGATNPYLSGATHYCANGQLVPLNGLGRYPFSWHLDMGVGYDWAITDAQRLEVKLTVYNLTNRQAITGRNTSANSGTSGAVNPAYLTITGLQAPRSSTLVLRYSF